MGLTLCDATCAYVVSLQPSQRQAEISKQFGLALVQYQARLIKLRRELAAPTFDAGDYVRFAPNARTGAGMAWEGAGGMSMGPNVEDFF